MLPAPRVEEPIPQNLNKLFENRVRPAVMSILMVNESVGFNVLKATLSLTDGNLASHSARLEKHRYVHLKKEFVGRKTLTTYALTALGRKSFAEHIDALERLIRGNH